MNRKITHKDLIDIEKVPKEEYDFYLDFFSEGSQELRNCLELMWSKNLFTSACCKGHNLGEREYICEGKTLYFIDLYAYINMKENTHIFKYLSKDLIMDPYVQLIRDHNRDTIYIYGRDRLKKIDILTHDIKTGIKDNNYLLDIFINKRISRKTMHDAYREYFYDNNFFFEEIARIEEINKELLMSNNKKHSLELCEEHNNILKRVRNRKCK